LRIQALKERCQRRKADMERQRKDDEADAVEGALMQKDATDISQSVNAIWTTLQATKRDRDEIAHVMGVELGEHDGSRA
jgi:cytidylate kinase